MLCMEKIQLNRERSDMILIDFLIDFLIAKY